MKADFIAVPASASIEDLVNNYIYKYHFKMFPVSDSNNIIGCVTTDKVKDVPRDTWHQKTVKDITKECSIENTISPKADAMQALTMMNRTGKSRLLVMDNGRLVGLITLKDMLKFLALKIDLEGK
jgi:predicted transcriptional regulator